MDQNHALIMICDNGRGLPVVDRHRLTEPYVTTREKGTGLGLAIVRKIMEDHNGEIRILDRNGGGAIAILGISRDHRVDHRGSRYDGGYC